MAPFVFNRAHDASARTRGGLHQLVNQDRIDLYKRVARQIAKPLTDKLEQQKGYVYVVQAGGAVNDRPITKVGFSADTELKRIAHIEDRCNQKIQMAFVTPHFRGAKRVEAILHCWLYPDRNPLINCCCGHTNNEWFCTDVELAKSHLQHILNWMAENPYDFSEKQLVQEWQSLAADWIQNLKTPQSAYPCSVNDFLSKRPSVALPKTPTCLSRQPTIDWVELIFENGILKSFKRHTDRPQPDRTGSSSPKFLHAMQKLRDPRSPSLLKQTRNITFTGTYSNSRDQEVPRDNNGSLDAATFFQDQRPASAGQMRTTSRIAVASTERDRHSTSEKVSRVNLPTILLGEVAVEEPSFTSVSHEDREKTAPSFAEKCDILKPAQPPSVPNERLDTNRLTVSEGMHYRRHSESSLQHLTVADLYFNPWVTPLEQPLCGDNETPLNVSKQMRAEYDLADKQGNFRRGSVSKSRKGNYSEPDVGRNGPIQIFGNKSITASFGHEAASQSLREVDDGQVTPISISESLKNPSSLPTPGDIRGSIYSFQQRLQEMYPLRSFSQTEYGSISNHGDDENVDENGRLVRNQPTKRQKNSLSNGDASAQTCLAGSVDKSSETRNGQSGREDIENEKRDNETDANSLEVQQNRDTPVTKRDIRRQIVVEIGGNDTDTDSTDADVEESTNANEVPFLHAAFPESGPDSSASSFSPTQNEFSDDSWETYVTDENQNEDGEDDGGEEIDDATLSASRTAAHLNQIGGDVPIRTLSQPAAQHNRQTVECEPEVRPTANIFTFLFPTTGTQASQGPSTAQAPSQPRLFTFRSEPASTGGRWTFKFP